MIEQLITIWPLTLLIGVLTLSAIGTALVWLVDTFTGETASRRLTK